MSIAEHTQLAQPLNCEGLFATCRMYHAHVMYCGLRHESGPDARPARADTTWAVSAAHVSVAVMSLHGCSCLCRSPAVLVA